MTVNSQAQAVLHAATQSSGSAAPAQSPGNHSEASPRAQRRRFFSKADKQRILQAADRCSAPGEIGALMRSEGVYSSSLSTWRRQRTAAEQATLAPRKRGPKPAADRDQALQIARLTRDNDRLKNRLDKTLFVIEVQKKVAALLGHPIDDSGETT